MAVLSFAHLKNRTTNTVHEEKNTHGTESPVHGQEKPGPPSPPAAAGVLSFAHLKGRARGERPVIKRSTKKDPADGVPSITDPCGGGRTFYRIPGVAKSALLVAVNFCEGCDRFLPATEQEKPYGNTYGRCLRDGEIDSDTEEELWRVIPEDATVARCYYFLNEKR